MNPCGEYLVLIGIAAFCIIALIHFFFTHDTMRHPDEKDSEDD